MAARFLTFEGADGAGKSTQARRLAEALRAAGREVVLTREPGGAPGAEEIRSLLVEGAPGRWSAVTETLLFFAARRDHVERTIRPALDRGALVICDRFTDSTRAYQAAARPGGGAGAPAALIETLQREAIGLEPDLTLVFDLAPEAARARSLARGGDEARFEAMGPEFQQRLRAAFLALAAAAPGRCVTIDAAGTEAEVAARVAAAALPRLGP